MVLRGLLVITAVLLVHHLLRFSLHPIVLILLTALPYALDQKLVVRTALFAVPFTVLLYWIWHRARHRQRAQWFWAYPFVLLVWSQLHGSYLLGVGLTLVLFTADVFERLFQGGKFWEHLSRYALVSMCVILAVGLIKPFPDGSMLRYGRSLIGLGKATTNSTELRGIRRGAPGNPDEVPLLQEALKDYFGGDFQTVFDRKPPKNTWSGQIRYFLQGTLFSPQDFRSGEFDFPFDYLDQFFVQITLAMLILGYLSFLVPSSEFRLPLFGSLLVVSVLSLAYVRTVAYGPLVVLPVLAVKYSAGDFHSLSRRAINRGTFLGGILVLGGFSGLIGGLTLTDNIPVLTGSSAHHLGTETRYSPSSDFVRDIRDKYPREHFFNNYDIGAFLVWHWWPRKKVFVDTKWSAYDPMYQERLIRTPLPQILQKDNINHAIVNDRSHWPLYFDRSEKWTLVADNDQFFVFERVEITR